MFAAPRIAVRHVTPWIACLLLAPAGAPVPGQEVKPPAAGASASKPPSAKPPPSVEAVAALIRRLGDPSFQVRDAAQKELIERACPEVFRQVKAALESGDPEVRTRARAILDATRGKRAVWAGQEVRKGLRWQWRVKTDVEWPVVVVGGAVHALDTAGTLHVLDAAAGKELWNTAAAAFAAGDKTVYVIDRQGRLRALDARTGKVRAAFEAGGLKQPRRVLAAGGTVCVCCGPEGQAAKAAGGRWELCGLDADSGRVQWTSRLPGGDRPALFVAEGMLYVLSGGRVMAIGENGRRLWALAVPAGKGVRLRAAAVGEGRIFLRAGARVMGVDGATGRMLWSRTGKPETPAAAADEGPSCLVGGLLYLRFGPQYVALDAATGYQRWAYRPKLWGDAEAIGRAEAANGPVVFLPGVAGLKVKVAAGAAKVIVVGPGPGPVAPPALSAPAVAEGVMYFAAAGGLRAVDVRKQSQLWVLKEPGLLARRPVAAGGLLYFAVARQPGKKAGAAPAPAKGGVILYALKPPAWR